MTKSELIECIANDADISKAAANRVLESVMGAITKSLKKGNAVQLVGFGSFGVSKRAARTGRNPRTGEPVEIAASTSVAFKPAKALKDSLN